MNVIKFEWVNYLDKPVDDVREISEDDVQAYSRSIGSPGGTGGTFGPTPERGMGYFQDPYKLDSVKFATGANGLKKITCHMKSAVSTTPTNALTANNSFSLAQMGAGAIGYATDNGVLVHSGDTLLISVAPGNHQ